MVYEIYTFFFFYNGMKFQRNFINLFTLFKKKVLNLLNCLFKIAYIYNFLWQNCSLILIIKKEKKIITYDTKESRSYLSLFYVSST